VVEAVGVASQAQLKDLNKELSKLTRKVDALLKPMRRGSSTRGRNSMSNPAAWASSRRMRNREMAVGTGSPPSSTCWTSSFVSERRSKRFCTEGGVAWTAGGVRARASSRQAGRVRTGGHDDKARARLSKPRPGPLPPSGMYD